MVLLWLAHSTHAIPLNDYHKRLQQAVTALDTLVQSDETETTPMYDARRAETINGVRNLLPQSETLEWNEATFNVNNSWLHQELIKYERAPPAERPALLKRIAERLQAIAEQVAEIENAATSEAANKSERSRKLAEILRRPEYAREIQPESALSRLWKRFSKWIESLMPKPKAVSPGTAGIISKIAEGFVILLALGVLGFVLKLFLPHLLRTQGVGRKKRQRARIVLGERLEPDQSAVDLLSEAEDLARRGELRGAIRRAYIALLVELGDRKIISLAQHKTNRDYLRAVRAQPLYANVKQLTYIFERHWYGLVHPTETDWMAFRSAYEQALRL